MTDPTTEALNLVFLLIATGAGYIALYGILWILAYTVGTVERIATERTKGLRERRRSRIQYEAMTGRRCRNGKAKNL